MKLILVRHGKAETDSSTGRDEDRVLRDRGERQAEHVAEWMRAMSPMPREVLCSGVVRAVQTARVLQQRLGCAVKLTPALETGAAASEALALITEQWTGDGGAPPLVLVGHNPQMEDVVGVLTQGPGRGEVTIRTGEAVLIDVPGPVDEVIGKCRIVEMVRLEGE